MSGKEKDKDKEGKEGKEEGESKRKSGLTVPGTLRLRKVSGKLKNWKHNFNENIDPLIVCKHEFFECSYRSFTWCSFCSDFIWGLSHQGWRCKVCGLDAHFRCVNLVTQPCPGKPMTPKSNSNQNLQELYEKGDFESIKNWANSDELPPPSPREGSIKSQASKDSKNTIIKLHNFQSLVYKTPTWCKHCNNFIWGFQKNGWKCQACGIDVHDKCLHNIRFNCHAKEVVEGFDSLQITQARKIQKILKANQEIQKIQLITPPEKYFIEDGILEILPRSTSLDFSQLDTPLLENPETSTAWYHIYFIHQDHDLFITSSKESDPFVMSILREHNQNNDETKTHQYRVIVWLKTGKEQTIIPVKENKMYSAGQVLEIAFPPLASKKKSLRILPRDSPSFFELQKQLLVMEKEQCNFDFKFGVLFVKKNQDENQMFSNREASPEFYQFLDLISTKINLRGWHGFRGGLDVKTNLNGEHSYYTEYDGNKVMFHVSTELPFTENEPQQLQRKRHIGNDIVCIIFLEDSECQFNPTSISSHFLHTFAVVCPEKIAGGPTKFRLNIASNTDVPLFGPELSYPPVFEANKDFRSFLLAKLINAEKAAYMAPAFEKRRVTTLTSLLQHIHKRFEGSTKKKVPTKLESPLNTQISPGQTRKDILPIITTQDENSLPPSNYYPPPSPSSSNGDFSELQDEGDQSATPWEEYDVIPVWQIVDEIDNGKSSHYDVIVPE